MTRLANKRCLIVGGTSGLGLATALRFRDEGARLAVAGVERSTLLNNLSFFSCDATDAEQVDHLFEQVVARLGGLDVLYHVAGGSGRRFGDGSLHECTAEGWQKTLALNLTSTFLTNHAAVNQFLVQGQGGVILNMASVLALSPSPHFFDTCAYTAAKGGVIALSKQAAARYAEHGIRVNVLAPGLIDTLMATRAVQDAEIRAFLLTKQPLAKGPGHPDDCAGAAVFLCSDEARLITGAVVPIDGGWHLSDGQFPVNPGSKS
jgi:NAD(P)-dependent dehydrogenase (short-subunit alcohol dehydrogenase family)